MRKSLDKLSSEGSPKSWQTSQFKEHLQIIHQRYPHIIVKVEPTTLWINQLRQHSLASVRGFLL